MDLSRHITRIIPRPEITLIRSHPDYAVKKWDVPKTRLSKFFYCYYCFTPNAAKITARRIFEKGPASAESAISLLGFLKFLVFIGTGFAQPKPAKSIHKNPIGSRCFIGFIVSLPMYFAVLSPSLYAAYAWENSCIVRTMRTAKADNK